MEKVGAERHDALAGVHAAHDGGFLGERGERCTARKETEDELGSKTHTPLDLPSS